MPAEKSYFRGLIAKLEKSALQEVEDSSSKLVFQNPEQDVPVRTNLQFILIFDTITSFRDAAYFIIDWIRKKKHTPGEVARDLPALIKNALLIRQSMRCEDALLPQPSMDKENVYAISS